MRKLIFGLAALPLLVGAASAADRLSDAQMDRITAGLSLPTIDCPGCLTSAASSTSINGVTITITGTGELGGNGGSPGGGSTGGGSTGGNGDTAGGGTAGGGTAGGGTAGGGTAGGGGSSTGGGGTTTGNGGSTGGNGGTAGGTSPAGAIVFSPIFLNTIVAGAGFIPGLH